MAARPAADLVHPRVGQQLEQQLRQLAALAPRRVDAAAGPLPVLSVLVVPCSLPGPSLPDEGAAGLADGPREAEALARLQLAQAGDVALALGRAHLERAALGVLGMVRAAADVRLRDRDQHGRRVGGAEAVAAEPAVALLRRADHVRPARARLGARAGIGERRQHGRLVVGAHPANHPALLVDHRQHGRLRQARNRGDSRSAKAALAAARERGTGFVLR